MWPWNKMYTQKEVDDIVASVRANSLMEGYGEGRKDRQFAISELLPALKNLMKETSHRGCGDTCAWCEANRMCKKYE